jgi:hypothetical protein
MPGADDTMGTENAANVCPWYMIATEPHVPDWRLGEIRSKISPPVEIKWPDLVYAQVTWGLMAKSATDLLEKLSQRPSFSVADLPDVQALTIEVSSVAATSGEVSATIKSLSEKCRGALLAALMYLPLRFGAEAAELKFTP